ncbi:MAG: hypothetical protein ABFD54_00290 [Armatimonadota bacterium]|nr:hypothetical protein [bacterium]
MRHIAVTILFVLICVVTCSTMSLAQTRTTPVEVKNAPSVKIDATANTVKMDPSGNSVKIDPTANTVQVSGTTSVNVANTPTVSVGNSPVVKIDSTQNTVKTPAQSTIISFATPSIPLAANGGTLSSPLINCAGYREMRIVSTIPSACASPENIHIDVRFRAQYSGAYALFGTGSFATATTQMTPYANFTQSNLVAYMSVPIVSDYARVDIVNKQTYSISISDAWVYLLN